MWRQLFQALLLGNQNNQKWNFIAQKLAQSYIYEDKGIDALFPDFKTKVNRLIKRMQVLKKPIFLSEGFRSFKKQNDYWYLKDMVGGHHHKNGGMY